MLFVRWAELVPSSTQALLTVCGTDMGPVEVQHGVALAPVRRFLTAAGIADSAIRWNAVSQCVYVGNRRIPNAVTLVDNVVLLPVRALAEFARLSCHWNPDGVITCTPT